jgi:hypothetical protein
MVKEGHANENKGDSGPDIALIEIRQETRDDRPHYTIVTNLKLVPAPLQNELQDILDCARLSLEAIAKTTDFSGRFDNVFMHIDPAQNRRLPLPKLKEEAAMRVTRAAFRDAMEAVGNPLEQARRVLAVWSKKEQHEKGKQVVLDFEDEALKFQSMPLSEKITFLEKRYGLKLDSDAIETILNLNRARNCVVHRFGHITERDCDAGGTMKVGWKEYAVLEAATVEDLEGMQNVRRVKIGDIIQGGHHMAIRRLPKLREYARGERIQLSAQDLSDICNTVYLFAMQVQDALRRHGLSMGIPMDPDRGESENSG